ncbi:Programmed_cell death protein-like protein [Hexamita inflata]|uniref:Programmed_cell death protein-like protein n=1 Tax=Hexamita inflata TaxID=28002 RepID=A0ABP1K130_9EUKA
MYPQVPNQCPPGQYPNPQYNAMPQYPQQMPQPQYQSPTPQMAPQMQQYPQQYPQQVPMNQMTPQQQQMFQSMDLDNSGTIEVGELITAYKHMNFPERAGRLLLLAVTDKPHIDRQTFPAFDNMVQTLYRAFAQFGLPAVNAQRVEQALLSCQFQVSTAQVHQLVKKYGQDDGCDFGQFLGIASYLLLCRKLIAKFGGNQGRVVLDLQGLTNLGMWFV